MPLARSAGHVVGSEPMGPIQTSMNDAMNECHVTLNMTYNFLIGFLFPCEFMYCTHYGYVIITSSDYIIVMQ